MVTESSLNGKWKLVQMYNGYFNGGSFIWMNVSDNDSHTLEFINDSLYIKQENMTNSFQKCTGTYHMTSDSSLEIMTDCSTTTQGTKMSELNSNELIINQAVIEGIIRYKYKAVK